MAVEIREMIIQAKMNEQIVQKSSNELSQNQSTSPHAAETKLSYALKRQIIEACVSEVMEKLSKLRSL
jgi:hypothetical protein